MKKRKRIIKIVAFTTAAAVACGAFAGCGAGGGKAELLTAQAQEDVVYESDVDTEEATSAMTGFSLDFMKAAMEYAEDENPVLSPASAYLALVLLACGSDGETAQELSETLRIPEGEWASYGSVIQEWLNRSNGETAIKTADSVWFDSDGGYEAKQEYLDTVSEALKAEVYKADLQSKGTIEDINKWVNDTTEGLIEKLREEPYDDLVRAVLLNALYFEAKWSYPFEAEATAEKTFTTADGKEITADFLRDYECHRYYLEADGIEGIMMPYTDGEEYTEGDTAFIALRSTDGKTPEEVLEAVSPEMLREFAGVEETTYMNFSMPKFDISYNQDLNDTFAAIGLAHTMSDGGADLSGMFENEDSAAMDLDAAQVVRIQVDEEGTKAAAVTELATSETAMIVEEPVELHFDSPFLYMIIDTKTGVPIFTGILENPAQ
jgi:serine protease inhibitor